MSDARQLAKALNEIKATEFQFKAASILLSVNGLENALEFVHKMGELNHKNEVIDRRLEFLYQRREAARKAYFDPDWDDPKEWVRTRKEFETAIHAYVESSKRYGREAPSIRERRGRYEPI